MLLAQYLSLQINVIYALCYRSGDLLNRAASAGCVQFSRPVIAWWQRIPTTGKGCTE
jgi:hypothetical protein